MKDQFGYTPNTGSYPPYFNITKVDCGYRVTVRRKAEWDGDLCLPMGGNIVEETFPEDFIDKLKEFVNG
jgi:hypothetical protein